MSRDSRPLSGARHGTGAHASADRPALQGGARLLDSLVARAIAPGPRRRRPSRTLLPGPPPPAPVTPWRRRRRLDLHGDVSVTIGAGSTGSASTGHRLDVTSRHGSRQVAAVWIASRVPARAGRSGLYGPYCRCFRAALRGLVERRSAGRGNDRLPSRPRYASVGGHGPEVRPAFPRGVRVLDLGHLHQDERDRPFVLTALRLAIASVLLMPVFLYERREHPARSRRRICAAPTCPPSSSPSTSCPGPSGPG